MLTEFSSWRWCLLGNIFFVIIGLVGGALLPRGWAGQLAEFTDGYTAAFLASGIAMLVAAAVGFFTIRGKKDELMPSWDSEDESACAH